MLNRRTPKTGSRLNGSKANAGASHRSVPSSLSSVSKELEPPHALSYNAGNTTRLPPWSPMHRKTPQQRAMVASATKELAKSVREISAQVQKSNRPQAP
jgi:hypothetical protein